MEYGPPAAATKFLFTTRTDKPVACEIAVAGKPTKVDIFPVCDLEQQVI
jgi:hypothetical protein